MNDQTSQKAKRAERSDKGLFMTMMGVFFLLFAIAPAYWAFYNFGEYRQTADFIRQLNEKSKTDATPGERQERGERISSSSARAERYGLEMLLSGAGGAVLFGIALLFFRKAWRSRNRKNFYENIDPRTIPIPPNRIEVSYQKLYDILFALIFFFFGGMLLLIIYQNFTSRFIKPADAIIRSLIFAVPIILLLSVICYLMIRAKRNALKFFDASGIKRGDGRIFAWNEFCGTVTQTAFNQRTQRKYIWRVELVFANGESAWLIPNRIKNYDEVFNYVASLPPAVLRN